MSMSSKNFNIGTKVCHKNSEKEGKITKIDTEEYYFWGNFFEETIYTVEFTDNSTEKCVESVLIHPSEAKKTSCVCGIDSIGGGFHSSYCPKKSP